jgi:hypothetical protein
MTCDVFIRSYRNDFQWLKYCLRSCEKHLSGFNRIHIAIPADDIRIYQPHSHEVVHIVDNWSDDYIGQQYTKLCADMFCYSDFILHVDSDCIFTSPTSPQDFMFNEKAVILHEDGVETPWVPIVARTMGFNMESEYMRRLPMIYPRWIYAGFREFIEKQHGMKLKEWMKIQPFHEFSEFNCLGAWLWRFAREGVEWKLPSEMPTKAKQFWSWGGIDGCVEEIEKSLAE